MLACARNPGTPRIAPRTWTRLIWGARLRCSPPIDFAAITTLPPPPLVPPPPVPTIQGDLVLNAQLATHSLDQGDRKALMQQQSGVCWAKCARALA